MNSKVVIKSLKVPRTFQLIVDVKIFQLLKVLAYLIEFNLFKEFHFVDFSVIHSKAAKVSLLFDIHEMT